MKPQYKMPDIEKFEMHALVELMGRQRIAGMVTERVIAGQGFLQVDVPETKTTPKFTRFIAPGSIYAINPIDEKTCLMYVDNLHVKPIDAWDLNAFMKKAEQLRLTGADAGVEDEVNAWMDDS